MLKRTLKVRVDQIGSFIQITGIVEVIDFDGITYLVLLQIFFDKYCFLYIQSFNLIPQQ